MVRVKRAPSLPPFMYMSMYILKRILFTIILFVAIFMVPWWVAFIISVGGIFYFKSYYEALVLGAFFDVLYGAPANVSFGYGIVGFMTMAVSFLVIKSVKQGLR